MSAIFPELFPDELLYSGIARLGDMMGFREQRALLRNVFGRSTQTAVFDLPGYVDALVERLPGVGSYTADRLIDKHTTLPYYKPFLPEDRINRARGAMSSSNGGTLHGLLGLRSSGVDCAARFRFCPHCVLDDRRNYGSAYWHRAHQMPGVVVCHTHRCLLREARTARAAGAGRIEYVSLERAIAGPTQEAARYSTDEPWLHALAEDSATLLSTQTSGRDPSRLRLRYVQRLVEVGRARHAHRLPMREIKEAMLRHYGEEALSALGCSIGAGENHWLARLLRRRRTSQHPLRHLLVLRFLGLTAEEFLDKPTSGRRDPRLPEPWVCLASSPMTTPCPSVLCRVPVEIGPRGAGAAQCHSCGCEFEIAGNARGQSRIRQYGERWDQRLRTLVQEGEASLRQIGRTLGVDPRTVQRHARRLGVWRLEWTTWKRVAPAARRRRSAQATLRRHRTTWERLRTAQPAASTQELRRSAPHTYLYLYRYDRLWLAHNRPDRSTVKCSASGVNWPKRDQYLLIRATEAVAEMLQDSKRPVRIRPTTVARRIGAAAVLQQRAALLPRTMAYLSSVHETDQAYGLRKLRWAAAQLNGGGGIPSAWQLIRKAALRPSQVDALQAEIEQILNGLPAQLREAA